MRQNLVFTNLELIEFVDINYFYIEETNYMTLVQLEYIVAVDTYRSFGIAAEHCFVTQPTLSMQIQKLEDELGIKLFDRSRQPVIPTEMGIELIDQARTILKEASRIPELISNKKGEFKGELRIGIIPTVAPYLMPKIISNFLEKYPDIRLVIWEYMTEQVITELKNGMLDCGILSTPLENENLSEIPLFYEAFVAYLSKSSPLNSKKFIQASDIDREELWLLNEGHCMRNQILNICNTPKEQEAKLFRYNTDNVETLKRMVDMNKGITLLPELAMAEFSVKQLDRVRYFKTPEPCREISLVTHRNFLKKKLISVLETEIISVIPQRMRSRKKKDVLEIFSS